MEEATWVLAGVTIALVVATVAIACVGRGQLLGLRKTQYTSLRPLLTPHPDGRPEFDRDRTLRLRVINAGNGPCRQSTLKVWVRALTGDLPDPFTQEERSNPQELLGDPLYHDSLYVLAAGATKDLVLPLSEAAVFPESDKGVSVLLVFQGADIFTERPIGDLQVERIPVGDRLPRVARQDE